MDRGNNFNLEFKIVSRHGPCNTPKVFDEGAVLTESVSNYTHEAEAFQKLQPGMTAALDNECLDGGRPGVSSPGLRCRWEFKNPRAK